MTIFLVERNGDISLYNTAAEAESSMESPDIEMGEYSKAFDQDGNVLSITTEGTIHTDRVSLIPRAGILTLTGENASSELYALLRQWWPSERADNPTLQELVTYAIETLAEANRGRWFTTHTLPVPSSGE